jgi:alpha-1,2-mannosyltransferase
MRASSQTPHALFFHPFHSAGGGGERVLWVAVRGLLDRDCRVSVISAGSLSSADLIRNQFGIDFKESEFASIDFVPLPGNKYLDHHRYVIAAVLMQNVAAALIVVFSFLRLLLSWKPLPTIFIDTTGFSFTLAVAKMMLHCKTVAYVHYPTMPREKLRENCSLVKKIYYFIFVELYALVGTRAVDLAMTNSKWTDERIRETWSGRSDTVVVYPPVKISKVSPRKTGKREEAVLSLGQFRPEKNHKLQLRIFSKLHRKFPSLKFWVVGGARDAQDRARVAELEGLAAELGITKSIEFVVNASRAEVERRLENAKITIHTMIDEHFGISLLEFLASGLVVVAHKSGGPEKDILVDGAGFLAASEDDYVDQITKAITNYDSGEMQAVIRRGYDSLKKFNDDDKFAQVFCDLVL